MSLPLLEPYTPTSEYQAANTSSGRSERKEDEAEEDDILQGESEEELD